MPGFWRKCRIAFRCARFTFWAVGLLALGAFAWFNIIGLPGFLKTRLVAALHEHGLQLEFTRMRLRFYRGLVCDNVRVGAADAAAGPVLTAREVQLRVDHAALLRFRLQLDGLMVRQGKFTLPLTPSDSLLVTNLQGELQIQPNDTWSLDHFRMDLAGATFTLAGEIEHAPECVQWQIFSAAKTPDRGQLRSSLQQFSSTLKQIHFAGQPQLNVRLNGDARDVHTFTLAVSARAKGVRTPWFGLNNLEFVAHVRAPTNVPPLAVGTPWYFWTNLPTFRIDWFARGADLRLDQIQAQTLDCTGVWGEPGDVHALALTVNARAGGVRTPWFSVSNVDFAARALAPTNPAPAGDPSWGFWTNVQPFQLEWVGRGSELTADQVPVDNFACSGAWNAPELAVTELSARLAGGTLETTAKLNVAAPEFQLAVNSDFDLHVVAPWLPAPARRQLARFDWGQPPRIHAAGTLALPSWTNRASWRADFPTRAQLQGDVSVTNLVLAGLPPVDSATANFACTNELWSLSGLNLTSGRTVLELSGDENVATRDFHCRVTGQLAAESIRPFLTNRNAVRGFDLLSVPQPVALTLAAEGNLHELTTLSATGQVAATNFAIREQGVDSLTAALSYSNLTMEFFHPQLIRAAGAEGFTAAKVTLDIAGQKLFVHEGKGHVSPMALAQAIGPKTAAGMEPYQFPTPPDAAAEGCIPLKNRDGELVLDDADLRVDLIGAVPFRWRDFTTPDVTGTICWRSNFLILTNVYSECYQGTAHGWGVFDLQTPGDGTDFSFFVAGTNVNLHAMGLALWSPTNQLRGALSGSVRVTRANSADWQSWNGFGEMQLHNGLLWNAPIFGIMSPVLNTFTPGLEAGNSRATDAAGSFAMTNGVIYTDSLEIRSLTMRLDYVGTVDLQENVSARTRAQLLRNTPLFGAVFSMVLSPVSKAFECGVTGTLENPKITPLYIPFSQLLAAPLHPLRTVEKIFSPPPTNGVTNP